MRPPGPEPGTCWMSTPMSRANWRTDGAAETGSRSGAEGAGVGASVSTGAEAASSVLSPGGGAEGWTASGSSGAGAAGSAAAPAVSSISNTTSPTLIVPPFRVRISVTTPATLTGISITALSVSASMTG